MDILRVTNCPYLDEFKLIAKQAIGSSINNGYGRQFTRFVDIPNYIRSDIYNLFGINNIFDEPRFGNFVGYHFKNTASVHLHKDKAPSGFIHVRCNVAVQMPDKGGYPIIAGKILEVQEGQVWLCYASEEFHSSTPIDGGQRLIVSLGALVEASELEN